jgi:DNA-binding transcriptional LysR family regulator
MRALVAQTAAATRDLAAESDAFDRLLEMEAASRKIDTWRQGTAGVRTVRLAAGTWIGWLLSRNMHTICSARDDFRIDLYLAERRASLSHRECDIGLRAGRGQPCGGQGPGS